MAALTAFFGLIGSFSRTGFLALVASIGTILLLRHHSLLGNRLLLVVGSAGLLFTATAITSHFVKFIRVRFIGELLSLDFVLADPRFQVAAPRMFDAFMEHPLFGSGFDLGTAGDIGFLVELASLGLVGFILYFLTISYVMHSAIQVIRLKPTGIYLPLAASVLAVSVGMLVASISGVPFRGTRLMEIYWLLVACLIFAKRDTLMALRNGQLQVDDSDANTTPDSTQRQHSGLTT